MKIEPLSGLTLGATVSEVDLANLEEPAWAEILNAFHEYGVLVFPGQHLSREAQTAFGKRFGQIEQDPKGGTSFEAFTLKNTKKDGSVYKEGSGGWLGQIGNEAWHADSTYTPVSSKAGLLSAQQLPPSGGGQTGFADMRAAYAALSSEMKERIAQLKAFHSVQYSQAAIGQFSNSNGHGEAGSAYLRPLVKVHPVTGRKSLFIARHAFAIPGLDPEESERLLDELFRFACQPPRVFEHNWAVGDIVVWDNRCILHRARPYDYSEVRIVRGTRIAGEESERYLEQDPQQANAREVFASEIERLRPRFQPGGLSVGNRHLRSAL